MGLNFVFRVPNIDGFRLGLSRVAVPLKNLTKVWPGAVRPLLNMSISQYSTQGGRGPHGSWPDLDPEYAERKRKKWGSKPIMQASGKSFAALLSPDAFRFEKRRMTYGVGPEFGYLFYHQVGFRTRLGTVKRVSRMLGFRSMFGRHIGLARVPARRIFDPREPGDRKAIQTGLARQLTVVYRAAGYMVWTKTMEGMEASEQALQGRISPGNARLAGIEFYRNL